MLRLRYRRSASAFNVALLVPPRRAKSKQPVPNPLRQGQRLETPVDGCAIVIFSASGDLTKRQLIPALFDLARMAGFLTG